MSAPILIDLPPGAMATLRQRAQARRMSPATLAHLLLIEVLQPDKADGGRDHALLAQLRALLESDLTDARDWDDLQNRFGQHGYTVQVCGGHLALFCTRSARHICNGSDLGWLDTDLIKRFGQLSPSSAKTHLAQRASHRANAGSHPDLFPDLVEEDIILIEDE